MPEVATPLAPGARVEIRDEEWVVERAQAVATGGEAVTVRGTSELVRDRQAIFLTELDEIRVLAPEETALVPDDSPRFRRSRLYLESLLRRTPPTDDRIHLGHQAAIDVVQYQLDPAAKALGALRPRVLMADGVGLGKTIEVGVLLTELVRRGRGRRILVVAMKSILEQFQEELWARFTIPLVRLDSVGVQRVQSRIPSSMNPFHFYDRVIVSIDTLKNDAKYRQYLEQCRWDVIVVDECQNVAMRKRSGYGRGSQRAQLAKLLARTCDALVLTSATPHDGSPESFASLMRLLDPTAIADEAKFEAEEVRHLFLRRFKKDVAHQIREVFPEREIDPHRLPASTAENAFLRAVSEVEFRTINQKRNSKGVLFRTTLLKAFLSSPAACISTIDKRLAHKHLDVENLEGAERDAAVADRDTLTNLRSLAERVGKSELSKYSELLALLRDAGVKKRDPRGRVVVFSERIDTVHWLAEHLAEDLELKPKQIAVFHGTLDDRIQMDLVKSFGSEDSPIRILLATDVAAEGINLHYYCHHLIHFDLPWSLITMVQRNGRIDRFGQKHTPYIHYLLTVPADSDIKGDLRVLERLIEKEDQAHKNLGDAAWMMNLHSEEKEEEEIAAAVQGEKRAEDVLPDEPRHEEGADELFEALFGDVQEEEPPRQADRPTLFPDDLAFAREAFESAVDGSKDHVRWIDGQQGLELTPPRDLERRYEYLPPELRRKRDRFRLTIDRDLVQRSLEAAREDENRWPEWELFWSQHPVCEWLDDRVLAAFGRHEAPVLHLTRSVGDCAFLCQGIFSNLRSQPVIVEWFAVPFSAGQAGAVVSFDDLLEATGLDGTPANPGHAPSREELAALEALREPAVKAARKHMDEVRADRAEQIAEPLRAGLRDLMAWAKRRKDHLEASMFDKAQGGGLVRNVNKARRATHRISEAEALLKDRKLWIEKSMKTVREPYIRIAAVLVAAPS